MKSDKQLSPPLLFQKFPALFLQCVSKSSICKRRLSLLVLRSQGLKLLPHFFPFPKKCPKVLSLSINMCLLFLFSEFWKFLNHYLFKYCYVLFPLSLPLDSKMNAKPSYLVWEMDIDGQTDLPLCSTLQKKGDWLVFQLSNSLFKWLIFQTILSGLYFFFLISILTVTVPLFL